VATASRRAKDIIEAAFETSVEGGKSNPLLRSRLHDFGFRGCCTVEQSVLGGCAHLLNFDGTDTMSAAFYAQFHLNGGRPVGMSIPATEHRCASAGMRHDMQPSGDAFGPGVSQRFRGHSTPVSACVLTSCC
jgi:nicotinamide phosphoribosyltransferase